MARLRRLVHAFLRSECDEAEVRLALGDAAPLYRDAPEAAAAREGGTAIIRAFMAEALPDADQPPAPASGGADRGDADAGRQRLSAVPRTEAEIVGFAEEMADMFDAYLAR